MNQQQVQDKSNNNKKKVVQPQVESVGGQQELGVVPAGMDTPSNFLNIPQHPSSQGMRQAMLQRLQKKHGNQSIQRLLGKTPPKQRPTSLPSVLRPPTIQKKMSVNEPNDTYEQEADKVADEVMRSQVPAPPPPPAGDDDPNNKNNTPKTQTLPTISRLQRKDDGVSGQPVTSDLESRIGDMQSSGGSPLPDSERAFFEPRMGVDLGNVRIHNNETAVQTSRELNAKAYTVGSDIAFNQGEYAPGTDSGRKLLAHELTHTIQQGATVQRHIQRQEGDAPAPAPPAPTTQSNNDNGAPPPPTSSPEQSNGNTPPSPVGGNTGDTAPSSPEEDTEFQSVITTVEYTAEEQQTHDPTEQKSQEAQDAAEMPDEEKEGLAQNTQVGVIESEAIAQETEATDGSPPGFDKEAFKAAVKSKIEAEIPEDAESMENIEDSGVMENVETFVDEKVSTGKEEAQGSVDDRLEEEPDESTVEEKLVTPLETNDPGEPPTEIDATLAAPKEKTTSEIEQPIEEGSQSLDEQLEEAEITEEQLAESNEPTFIAGLDAKHEAQENAEIAPQTYRDTETSVIGETETDVQSTTETQVQEMVDTRVGSFTDMDGLQSDAQTVDEEKRAEIGQAINGIYETTRTEVETILTDLDTAVDTAFSIGADNAKTVAIDYIKRETQAFKDERYNRDGNLLEQAGGSLLNLGDTVGITSLPPEYYDIYNEGRDLYIAEMDIVLDDVADIVGDHLTRAKERIQQGRQEIVDYVASQPEELQQVAQEEADKIQSKFDELEQTVDEKEQALIDSLAERYNEGLQALDSEIEAMKEKDKGLLQQAYDALAGPIEQILALKEMLLGVLSRAQDAVMTIIADPIGFIGNLIDAVGMGLQQFVTNIATHLQTGFVEWLTGTMSEAGITMPEDIFSLQGVLDLGLQVIGLTYENIRARAVGVFGEGIVSALETGFELFMILKNEGLIGLWDWIQDQLSNLKEMVIEGIKEMLISEVVEAGIEWLISMLGGPAGAFVKACMMIYDIVMWFINNAQRIMALVNAVIDGVMDIAAGNIQGAADYVEQALATFIPTAIGFLASLIGLGDLSTKVRKIIERIQEPVNNALDTIFNAIRDFVMKIAKMLGFDDASGGQGDGEIGKTVNFSTEEESHRLYVDVQGSQATLMVASTPMTVEERLADWETRANDLDDEKKAEAQGLLSRTRGLLSDAEESADYLAEKKTSVKTVDDGDPIQQEQSELETEQDSLADILRQLFELFGDSAEEDDALIEATIRDTEKPYLTSDNAISEENAKLAATGAMQAYPEVTINVLDGNTTWDYQIQRMSTKKAKDNELVREFITDYATQHAIFTKPELTQAMDATLLSQLSRTTLGRDFVQARMNECSLHRGGTNPIYYSSEEDKIKFLNLSDAHLLTETLQQFSGRSQFTFDEWVNHFVSPELQERIDVEQKRIPSLLAGWRDDNTIPFRQVAPKVYVAGQLGHQQHPSALVDDSTYNSADNTWELKAGKNTREALYGTGGKGRFNSSTLTTVYGSATKRTNPQKGNRVEYRCNNHGGALGWPQASNHQEWIARQNDSVQGEPHASLDHIIEVVDHWQNTGYNQTHSQRRTWFNEPNNLRVVCDRCNSTRPKAGHFTVQVGPNFRGEGEG